MSEIEDRLALGRESWRRPTLSQFIRWVELSSIQKAVGIVVVVAIAALAVESFSAYVLYRHYARLEHPFYPAGSATLELARNVAAKAEGHPGDEVVVTIDHGPLFRANTILGYSMYPGTYRITERRYHQSHVFDLTVDEHGRRITSATAKTGTRRIYLAGDSAMFGWGLNDDETMAWLLQSRFPNYDVENLSLTSYSTVQTLLELEHADPKVAPEDTVVIAYHPPLTNDFNVASDEMLFFLRTGFEHQLGDDDLVHHMVIPFGTIDAQGKLEIQHYAVVACARPAAPASECPPRQLAPDQSNLIAERAFDAVLAAHPGHVVIALLGGEESDPVLEHLRSSGVMIADLRREKSEPDATDAVTIDQHAGPFWHHSLAERLGNYLDQMHLVN
jgi:hypothetical protein